jgi:hypothetical protein
MSMVRVEWIRRSWRRGPPRFLIRNAQWVAEARDRPSLWAEWAAAETAEPWSARSQVGDDRADELEEDEEEEPAARAGVP